MQTIVQVLEAEIGEHIPGTIRDVLTDPARYGDALAIVDAWEFDLLIASHVRGQVADMLLRQHQTADVQWCLSAALRAYCDANDLPHLSADELPPTPWLSAFVALWDATDAEARKVQA